jgi:hypothetical protein
VLAFLAGMIIVQYVINVKYNFPKPQPFTGKYLYNPYKVIDTSGWQISNFHAHTHRFLGNRSETAAKSHYLDSLYSYLGYNNIGISDYQMINTFESKHSWFVPVYEHGYQYYKNHHLVLNARNVSWLDYFFRQTLNNKQFVINQLKKDTFALVTIVHPILRKAISHNDLKYLTNYDFLEVIDNKYLFTSYYDTVLSSGHPVFLMADDDCHNLKNPTEYGSCFNWINTFPSKDSILKALKTGASIAVKLNLNSYKTDEQKKVALHNLPILTDLDIINDTIYLTLNKEVKTIKFIGQQGVERKRISDTKKAACLFSNEDTYLRAEIECNDGTLYLLNPVLRYDGSLKFNNLPPVDVFKTWVCRSALFVLLMVVFTMLMYRK